jgi:uncharacterized RDD family membrane protein YckC
MRMLPENPSFFIRGDDGQEYGPVELGELRGWVQENRAGLGTEVRRDEFGATWHPWQNYPELVALLAEIYVTHPVTRPPGVVIAPIRRRVVALMADLMLLWILFVPIVSVLELFLPMDAIAQAAMNPSALQHLPPETLHQILAFQMLSNGVLALYLTGFLAAHGQTPGKAIMRLRVVGENGQKPPLVNAFLRSVVLIFSIHLLFLPLIYAFFNPQRRALHDFIAGTYVVEA